MKAIFALLILMPACSSLYWKNRLHDSMDIFTAEVSTQSYGVALRAGPLKFGAHYKSPSGYAAGLRGGQSGRYYTAEFAAAFMGADYFQSLPFKDLEKAPKKDPEKEAAESQLPADQAATELFNPEPALPVKSEALLYKRGKEFRARSPFGSSIPIQQNRRLLYNRKELAPFYYYTQLEITLGLYGGLKLGLNAGELIDFLLGFFGVDFMNDDAPYLSPEIRELKKLPQFKDATPEELEKLQQFSGN
jgi:hypothetical protein